MLSGEQFSVGDPLGSGQEMDKTVRPKAKADNTSVCGVPSRYSWYQSSILAGSGWIHLPVGGNPQGKAQLAGYSGDLAGGGMLSAWRSRPGERGGR